MKTILRSPVFTVAIFVLAAALLGFGTVGAVQAAPRVQSGDFRAEVVLTNIETALTDVQLGFFTPEGIGGNHTHLQVNDATYPEYREKKLAGAYQVTENASASSASSN